MKIQEFYSKVRASNESLFQTLGKLRNVDARVFADDPESDWTPWPEMTESAEDAALA